MSDYSIRQERVPGMNAPPGARLLTYLVAPDGSEEAWSYERVLRELNYLLRVVDAADTALALIDRSCGDAPAPDKRCMECVGCAAEAAFQWAETTLRGQQVPS